MRAGVEQTGWQASLGLRFAERNGETLLLDRRHCGPLRVQRPFYPESRRVCHVYMLHPPGGLVSGDRLETDIRVDTGAWGLVTTPGAGKLYRSNGRDGVNQHHRLQVAAAGTLEWLPQETIVFDGAQADLSTRVELQAGARFLGWEITCLGRPASGEALNRCDLRQRFEVWRDDRPLWLERSRYGDNSPLFEAAWGLRGFTVTGSLFCTDADDALLENLRNTVRGDNALFSASRLYGGLVCRYLGHHAEQARTLLQSAWRILRPAALGAAASSPRIWQT